jgi:hypothetical protein
MVNDAWVTALGKYPAATAITLMLSDDETVIDPVY